MKEYLILFFEFMYGKQTIKSIRAIVDERGVRSYYFYIQEKLNLFYIFCTKSPSMFFFQKIEAPNSTVGPLSGAH